MGRYVTRDQMTQLRFEELSDAKNVKLLPIYSYVFAMTNQAIVSVGKTMLAAPSIDNNLRDRLTCFSNSNQAADCNTNTTSLLVCEHF